MFNYKTAYLLLSKILFSGFLVFVSSVICFSQNKPKEKTQEITPATVTYKRKTSTPPVDKPTQAAPAKEPLPAPKEVKAPQPENKYDTIIKLGGKKIICTVKKVNPTTVEYVKPEAPTQLEIPRKEIERIVFRNGRKEVYNKPVFSMIDQTQWEAVLVTENEAEVEGLYKKGVVKANAASGSRSPKAAKTSATIRLQKKAANLGALIVLVVRSEMKGGYGEIPGWELEGIAYSDTPPVDTATVNAQIRKMIERNRQKVQDAKKKN